MSPDSWTDATPPELMRRLVQRAPLLDVCAEHLQTLLAIEDIPELRAGPAMLRRIGANIASWRPPPPRRDLAGGIRTKRSTETDGEPRRALARLAPAIEDLADGLGELAARCALRNDDAGTESALDLIEAAAGLRLVSTGFGAWAGSDRPRGSSRQRAENTDGTPGEL
ncbi:MAG: hypothetical protein IT457_19135 [Planctomycetes bacterium]|nr:hypothetical protein [Planctomycetota bacterium]